MCASRFKVGLVALLLLAGVGAAVANDPGGGTNGVGADVTLTDSGSSVTLANGIVTATIDKGSGKITSMLYGGRQVVQSGGNVYYSMDGDDGYRDMSSCAYVIKTNSTDIVDVSFRQTWNSSLPYAFDIEAHWVLRRGNSGIYAYALLDHPANYPSTTNVEWRCVWKFPNDVLERTYVDQLRHWQMPSSADIAAAQATSIAEILKIVTGVRAGYYDSKYEYSAEYENIGTWGHASSVNKIGAWFVTGNYEYFNDGPTKQDLTLAWDYNVIHFGRNHYTLNDSSVTYGQTNVAWKKIYGPFLLYLNTNSAGGDALWADAKAQVQAEHNAWPYSWLTGNTNYPLADARGAVGGRFLATDSLKSSVSTSNAWVGLGDPSVDWQFDMNHYEYWVRAAADGSFAIQNIRPGTYTLHAFTDGEMGEYSFSNVVVTSGSTNALGDLAWSVPRTGNFLLWEIGTPNRTANKFRHGSSNYYEGFIWNTFASEFPNPLEYNIGASDWSKDLNYVHDSYTVNGTSTASGTRSPWKWRLNFLMSSVPASGNATLNFAFASVQNGSSLDVYVNNESSVFTTITPSSPPAGGNALVREGIHAKYITQSVSIPVANLRVGTNTFSLIMTSTGSDQNHFMYDAINLELPSKPPLPAGYDLTWTGGNASNVWDLATTNWSNNSVARIFANGNKVLFDDTGLNNPAIVLTNALSPGAMTIYAMKSFTFTGSGSLTGAMTLAKSGPGTLTFNNTNTFTGATSITNGALVVNGSLNSSAVTVRFGASVGGTGKLGGGLTAQAGSTVQPGITAAGTLVVSNALVESGSVTNLFDLSDDVTGVVKTNDLIKLAGNLNVSGTNIFLVNPLNGILGDGIYPLIQYSGTLTGGVTNFVVRGVVGKPFALTNLSGTIALIVISNRPPTNVVWHGGLAANIWDQSGTSNWLNGAALDVFAFDDNVTFDDTGSTSPAVNLSGDLTAASVTVNASVNYTFSGSGGIVGDGGLMKLNSGTLTVLTTNKFTGPVLISGGALAVNALANGGSPGAIGASSADASNLVFQSGGMLRYLGTTAASDHGATLTAGGGTIEVTNSVANLTFGGALTGVGGLSKIGPGTFTLAGSNDYSGGTLISAGILQMGAGASSGTLGSGTVTNNSVLTFSRADAVTISPVITGSGIVVKSGGGSVTLVNADAYTGGTTNSSGILVISNNAALGSGALTFVGTSGSVQLANGVTVTNNWNIPGATVDLMLDCPTGTATWAGNVSASGGGSFRPGTSSGNGTLVYSGTANMGGANFIVPRGNVVIASNGIISAGGTVCALGRSSSGSGTTFVAKDSASLTFGSGFMLGHTSSGSPYPIVFTIQDNAVVSCGVSNLDLHNSPNAAATTTLNLNGGTLSAGGLKKSQTGANQTSTVNFNGGLLRASAANAAFLDTLSGLTADVSTGGAKIDDGGFALTIPANLIHDPALGATLDGGLTKLGAGKLTLSGTNTLTGNLSVSNGTLALAAFARLTNLANIFIGTGAIFDVSLQNPLYTLGSGRTISGSGVVKGIFYLGSGAILSPGGPGNQVGTLTFSNNLRIGFGPNALNFKLGSTNNSDRIFCGTLESSIQSVVNVTPLAGFGPGTYKLISYNLFTGDAPTLGVAPAGYGYSLVKTSYGVGEVQLIVTSINNTPPALGPLSFTNGILNFNGSNGVGGGMFYLLASTNLSTPTSNWLRLLTNQFDNSGNFNFSTNTGAGLPQNFFRLQLP